jgi:hypothetical protein
LTLELSRKLQPYIGRIRKKHYAGVAKLAKELTKTRSPDDALKYLRSKPGIEWGTRQRPVSILFVANWDTVEGYLVPDRAEPVDGAVHQAIGEAVIGVVPIGVSFPNDSINNELSPLLAKVERSTYQQGQIYASQRVQEGRLPVGVASLPWFAFFVFVFVLVVWVISIPSEMAWSLG